MVNNSFSQSETYYEKLAVKKSGNHMGLFMILLFAIPYVIGVVIAFPIMIFNRKDLLSDPVFLYIFNNILTFIVFFLIGIFIARLQKHPVSVCVNWGKPKLLLPAILLGLGCCWVANIATNIFIELISPVFTPKMPDLGVPESLYGYIIYIISMSAFPALLEEFAFRGVIMGSLMKFGKNFAILMSAIIFALIHGNLVQIPFAFIVGLALGFLVAETGSIWTGIAIHFLNNLISCLAEGAFEDELLAMGIMAVMLLLGIIGAAIFFSKRKVTFEKTLLASTAGQRAEWFLTSPSMIIFYCTTAVQILMTQAS